MIGFGLRNLLGASGLAFFVVSAALADDGKIDNPLRDDGDQSASMFERITSLISARNDPVTGLNFRIEIDGLSISGVQSIQGLGLSNDAITYREGSDTPSERILPGLLSVRPITISRGISPNKELWNWTNTMVNGATERKAMAIILMNEAREDVVRYELGGCWPTSYEVGPLNAEISVLIAEESITIQCESFDLSG
ncbi:MAG: phage tail protein [Pseudomonadota bacterium]